MAGEKVLIIEDRRENIVYLANSVLKPQGYHVITAMDGEQGLQRAITDKPDLIIMDLNMPKRDGLEVMNALREQQLAIPVILTTFYGSEQVAQQAFRLGASGYVVKPYQVEEMLAAVRKALALRRPSARSTEPSEPMPLSHQIERWMRDMNILHNVGKALVAQLDLESVLARAIESAIYIIRADQAFLLLAGRTPEAGWRLRAVRGPADPRVRLVDKAVESRLVSQALRSDKPLLQSEIGDEPGLAGLVGGKLGAMIAAPLRWHHHPMGVLIAGRVRGEAAFRDTDAEWLAGLADYVAIALQNARVFQQRADLTLARQADFATCRQALEQLERELDAARQTAQRLAAALDQADKSSED